MASTILFTGGHHNSALVIALSLKKQGHKIVWLGHKFTMRGDKVVSAEYQEVTAHKIPFTELKTGKFYRKTNPMELLKIAVGFVQAFFYLLANRPQLIVAFGGYLSVPVVICGWLLGIPSVTHEQTVTAGWANRATAPFVKKILLTHQSSLANYPKEKAVVTGLPIRDELLAPIKYKKPKRPLIYVTCGKQGSQVINQALFPIIPALVEKYQVIHQTGAHTLSTDQDKARRVKKSLPLSLRRRYIHQPYFFTSSATKYLHTAKLIISRAGAHIAYELLYLNKRSVVIPISWVSHNEQMQNAKLLAQKTPSVLLTENDLNPQSLHSAIKQALQLKTDRLKKPAIYLDAKERILKQLQPYLVS